MRKILSKQEGAKKQKRNRFIVGGILIFIMLFSAVGYSFYGSEGEDYSKKMIYNGFEFINNNGLWFLVINDANFAFTHNPKEVSLGEVSYGANLNVYVNPVISAFPTASSLTRLIPQRLSFRHSPTTTRATRSA